MRDMFKGEPNIPNGFSEIVIDSGGYQLQTGVSEVYLKAYSLWLNLLLPKHPEIVGYMNLDILGDSVATMENQFYLESEGLHPLPIWHAGTDIAFLDYYCEKYEWVSIGGIVGGRSNKQGLLRLVNFITQRHPNTKFHFFGIGISGVKAYLQVRPYSCDFSTWSTSSRFGHGVIKDDKQIIKEIQLPKEDRDRIRTDPNFARYITLENIKNIKYFEKTLNGLKDTPHQLVLH